MLFFQAYRGLLTKSNKQPGPLISRGTQCVAGAGAASSAEMELLPGNVVILLPDGLV